MEHRGSGSRERSNSGGGSYGDRDYSELYSLKDVFSDEYYTKKLNTILLHTLTEKIGTGIIMSFRTTKINYI